MPQGVFAVHSRRFLYEHIPRRPRASAAATTTWSPRSRWPKAGVQASNPRAPRPGRAGAAMAVEARSGFRCSTLAHTAGPVRPDIVRDMQLEKHGLRFITPEFASPRSRPKVARFRCIWMRTESAQAISAFSGRRRGQISRSSKTSGKISKVIAEALATTPPDIDHPSSGDLWSMLKTGRALRNLGKRDMYRVSLGTNHRPGSQNISRLNYCAQSSQLANLRTSSGHSQREAFCNC